MRLDTGLAVRITIAHVISFRTDPSFAIFHPFLDGCYSDGDLVADTPPETETESPGCSLHRDSCEGGGMDLMDNYMDYYYE
jgi:hypothetical protein